eukprot:271209_1
MNKMYIMVIILCVDWLLFSPTLLYCGIKYQSMKRNMFIQKRQPRIQLFITIICLIHIAIYSPLYAFQVTFPQHHDNIILNTAMSFIFSFTFYSMLYATIIKIWLLYFDSILISVTKQNKWQVYIDRKEGQNWFIQHKDIYGKLNTTLLKIVSIPLLITVIIVSLVGHLQTARLSNLWAITNTVCIIIPGSFLIVTWNKTHPINDTLLLYKEVKDGSKAASICFVIYILFCFLLPAFNIDPYIRYIIDNVWILTLMWFGSIYHTAYGLIVLWIQPKLAQKRLNLQLAEQQQKRYVFEDIFGNEKIFHLFMVHLSSEYSMECLLSVIEFIQFQKYIIDRDELNIDQNILKNEILFIDIEFPSNVPMSGIVNRNDDEYQNDRMLEYKKKAYNLWEKYIEERSYFEINISALQRDKLNDTLSSLRLLKKNKDITVNDMVLMFEDSKQEMIKLIGYSLSRFQLVEQTETLEIEQVFASSPTSV